MTKRSINLYELIFGAFFVLKLAKLTPIAEWNWFFIFLPLMLNFIVKFFEWIWDSLNLKRSATKALQNAYYDKIREKAVKEALKEAVKK